MTSSIFFKKRMATNKIFQQLTVRRKEKGEHSDDGQRKEDRTKLVELIGKITAYKIEEEKSL